MRVAIDNGPLSSGHSVRGVGAYTRELINALGSQAEAVDFAKTDLSDYDILHYPYFNPFIVTLPFRKTAKIVVTIHDLIPLLYPTHYVPGIKGDIKYFVNKILIKKVDAIITDTETSKKDIVRFLSVPYEKVHVVYLAPRKIFKKIVDKKMLKSIQEKYNLPKEFVLYVGDINYNKNIPGLINAARIAKMPLVIVGKQAVEIEDLARDMKSISGVRDFIRFLLGKPHPELKHYQEIVKSLENNTDVFRLGYVSDEDLVAIYNLSSIYCQPSFYEGFGLPVLEAVTCGSKVVASRTQALVEVLGNASIYFDPKSPDEIARALKINTKNGKLPREYSWTKTAKETMDVYKSI